ncbi:sigma factor-like helix-turn-helix DNA-binding protein [Rhodococcus kronopolitis]|uniref:Sigma factor-like helix-turn-helix DNA-binding protein n=1 Tax=Rhodococcus kronopolitis TaxID=1460226 RepID=A0ABV9FV36_9NOCA
MTEEVDFSFDDVRPRCWADAFPWLAGAAGVAARPWWDESIDDTDLVTRRARLGTVSELAMERLTGWTIGQIFPGLPADIDLVRLDLPVRAANALTRADCGWSGQLMPVALDSMLGWRGIGVGTVDAILRALADVSTSVATPTVADGGWVPSQADSPLGGGMSFAAAEVPEWALSLVEDLKRVATWYGTVGLPGQRLVGGVVPAGTPDEIVEARARLEALNAGDVLSDVELGRDVAGLFDAALGLLDPRAAHVLGDRLFADDPATLDELGREHGVTRERIRQIESKSRGALLSSVSGEGALAAVAEAARDLIGVIRPLDDLVKLIPALGRMVESVRQPAWRVLDRLDDAYEIEDGWCVVPTMTAAMAVTQTQLQECADEYGVVRLDEIELIESSHPEQLPDLTAEWLRHCGYIVDGDVALIRTSSVNDYAAAILSLVGSSLTTEEIVDRFVFERSSRSLGNALSRDERFVRADRDRWALTEWGVEEYTNIRSIIRDAVLRGGGRAHLDEVIEYITTRYSVSASSVVAYAAAAPFVTNERIVSLGRGGRAAGKAPERTRRLFRRPDGWALRVRITTDHLRGSGSVAPAAVATVLGLQSGETVQLDSPLGSQMVAWTGIQPAFGTIRRFLLAEDVAADAEVFLVLRDDRTFGFELARELSGDPVADALALIGAAEGEDREQARVAFATALGMPEDSPVVSIIGEYRTRGDGDVAELLVAGREHLETGHGPVQRQERTKVDDILDLL